MSSPHRILVAQGGGPTAVINQSLVGVALEARRFGLRQDSVSLVQRNLSETRREKRCQLVLPQTVPMAFHHRQRSALLHSKRCGRPRSG